jgi:AcrR family transcriptional regulator
MGSVSTESLPRAVRRRAREEITREILEAARRQLATVGAPGLSLRAVARELGMVSSAVYRYVASRDDLLTLLIIDAYDALGAAVEAAEAAVPRPDLLGRWLAVSHGVRDWALAHPNEYALLYGSPVPGYVAPEDTIGPATRVTALMARLLQEVTQPGAPDGPAEAAAPSDPADLPAWVVAMGPTRPFMTPQVPPDPVLHGLVAWTHLYGAVSFELFGHYHRVLDDDLDLRRAFFTETATRMAALVGIRADR